MIYWIGGGFLALLFFKKEATDIVDETVLKVETFVATQNSNWTRWDAEFKKAGAKYKVPWAWLKAIAMNESSLGSYPSVALGIREPANIEGSKSQDGKSWGLMQVTLTTGRGLDPYCTAEKLNNPEYSIDLAGKYLSQLSGMFSKVELKYTEWVIKSYNQGPGNTNKERTGKIPKGYADEYWARFERNLQKVEASNAT